MKDRRTLFVFIAGLLALSATASETPQLERLGRGVIALHPEEGKVWIAWRLLGTDPTDAAFNVYRAAQGEAPVKLNTEPLAGPTFFIDEKADFAKPVAYSVRLVTGGREQEPGKPYTLSANAPVRPYLSIPIQTPNGYTPGDASAGDLDGDGEYEIVLHQTKDGRDNSQGGVTGEPILQAYKLDGTLLWTINLGRNIREGAHYTQFMVYDLDGDGRAEVACRTADGTVDGKGNVIGDAKADHRNKNGYVLSGPEFLTLFDGRTGAELTTTKYIPPRHPETENPTPAQLKALWGDDYGNRCDRFLACVAYLDGRRPSLVMCRGYYTRAVLAAWDWRDGKLTSRWVFDSDTSEANRAYRGQGNHQICVADVDGDGRDEIIYGAAVIDDDGKGLYSTGWGHGDAMHVGDLVPENPGLEIFSIQERFAGEGMNMRDAKTGKPIWLIPSTKAATSGGDKGEGPGRGVSADIDPRFPGAESWAAGAGMDGLYDAKGNRFLEKRQRGFPCNFIVYWDGDFLSELLDKNAITKWNWEKGTVDTLLKAEGCSSCNGTKATPCLSADLLGDWREEVLWRTDDGKELRLYSTTIPTKHRLVTLMHDRQYRLAIAWQNVAYNQPPHLSFAPKE
jgi:rhamnogalacturonan endolyase